MEEAEKELDISRQHTEPTTGTINAKKGYTRVDRGTTIVAVEGAYSRDSVKKPEEEMQVIVASEVVSDIDMKSSIIKLVFRRRGSHPVAGVEYPADKGG